MAGELQGTGIDLGSISSGATNVGVILFVGFLIVGTLIGITWAFLNWKRYRQFRCVIYYKDGHNQLRTTYDQAGIFVDSKTKNKRFFLKKGKVGLDADKVPVFYDTKGKATVYLYKKGEKNYYFLKPNINDKEGEPTFKVNIGEEDVNWAINTYEREKNRWLPNTLLQYMPYIIIAFVSIMILVIFIYFFKEFSTLRDVAMAFKEAAAEIAKARMNTTIIQ